MTLSASHFETDLDPSEALTSILESITYLAQEHGIEPLDFVYLVLPELLNRMTTETTEVAV